MPVITNWKILLFARCQYKIKGYGASSARLKDHSYNCAEAMLKRYIFNKQHTSLGLSPKKSFGFSHQILIKVTIVVMKHHDQKEFGEERIY